jgi:4-hydroxyphenylpyruvate dioxygenase-like putative hemolysin
MSSSTAIRSRLPTRRASETFGFQCNGQHCLATVSFFPDGRLAEIFISTAKAGSHSDSAAKDSAVVASIALQYGVPLETITHALLRDASGRAASPLGQALDLIAEQSIRGGAFSPCHSTSKFAVISRDYLATCPVPGGRYQNCTERKE